MAYYIDPELRRAWALEDIEAIAGEVQQATDDELAITWATPRHSKGVALVEASADAGVLVVGLHGPLDDDDGQRDHGDDDHDVAPWLRHALIHAPCPVVVVPPDR